MHPAAHPLHHEDDALTVLSGLRPIKVRNSEVASCPEPFGTLLVEVPDREAGFILPTWDELVSLVDAARDRDAVVHLDGTARPQLIDETTEPFYYDILNRYHRLTGIPSLINTSYNMHEEPIVCTPHDAVRAFQQGHLDHLVIGPFLASPSR